MTATQGNEDRTNAGRRATATFGEAAIVLGGTVALFLSVWIRTLVTAEPSRRAEIPSFTNARVLRTLGVEFVVSICLLPWLLKRGWKPREIAGSPSPKDVMHGAGLWLGTMAFAFSLILGATILIPGVRAAVERSPFTGQLSIAVAATVAILNAVFEEFLWLVYAIPTLTNRLDAKTAAVISGTLRLSVHAYQGVYALIGVLPITIVFTLYYVETRRVWPVIVAHIVIDAISFSRLIR